MFFVMRHSEYERENIPTYGFCDEAPLICEKTIPTKMGFCDEVL